MAFVRRFVCCCVGLFVVSLSNGLCGCCLLFVGLLGVGYYKTIGDLDG